MSGVWEREMEALVRRQEQRVKLHASQIRNRREKAKGAMDSLAEAEDSLIKVLKDFQRTSQKLLSRREDPEVVVRNYNKTTLYVYHADTGCGWIRNPRNTERILLSQAEDRGYEPCKSCGYRVPKRHAPEKQTSQAS